MKTLIIFFAFALCLVRGADLPPANVPVFITIAGVSVTARYVELSTAGIASGQLVYVGAGLGDGSNANWAGKIVLFDRGPLSVPGVPGIGYFAKAEAVRLAGGVACVVANISAGPYTGNLGAGNTSPLPIVTVSMEDGLALRAKAGSAAILGPIPPAPPPVAIPDPAGHEGEYLVSQGGQYVFAKKAPGIVSISIGALVSVGDPVTLSATADGLPQPALQWFKDGRLLAGMTDASFVVSSAIQLPDAGEYKVIATNPSGSATSQAFVLTVQPAIIGLAR